jgi:hypothetical protein
MAAGDISFDSNNLQTASILTQDIKHEGLPTKDAKIYSFSHANKSSIPFVSYPQRSISVKGVLNGSSIANLDSIIDTFKNYFLGTDKNLDIGYNGSTRRYIATAANILVDRPGGLLYANFQVDFICSQPFGRNTATTSALSATGRTLSGYTDPHTFLGTAPYQLPLITITITAVTGGASFLYFGNSANGQGITITDQTFIAGDVVAIDCDLKTVTKNGVAIDFIGAFPEFAPGAQTFSYSDGFTTRTFNITVAYYPMYL